MNAFVIWWVLPIITAYILVSSEREVRQAMKIKAHNGGIWTYILASVMTIAGNWFICCLPAIVIMTVGSLAYVFWCYYDQRPHTMGWKRGRKSRFYVYLCGIFGPSFIRAQPHGNDYPVIIAGLISCIVTMMLIAVTSKIAAKINKEEERKNEKKK